MAITTVGMMLDSAKEFETILGNYLADIRDRAEDDTVRLLTYYLARFKKHLPNTIDIFTADQYQRIRQIPLKDVDAKFISERCFDGKYLSSKATAQELLETSAELIDILLSFYQWLVSQPTDAGAQGLLQHLVVTEEKGLNKLKQMQAGSKF